ncbi:pyruvate kinase [Desulfobulbus propionicus DSM 2032]|uniref:Pyruvate kinase n=1 Tax=Desulfobulbus propionicus (strain ATCC 33891 / DSM 2032 / VKM B-1956 / 1pr3) TaxID=577650 RepID=A0A7U3YPX4_DESPD|nr:pyruvate kinase [Desulfobulbus propionicus]ADW19383.1 pyruvate kinase [Desulfobulbus propionicus DSM 2032]
MYNTPILPACKTKLVCTIGPASDSPEMLEKMLEAGMNIARLNFSHGDFRVHGEVIRRIRQAAERVSRPVAIMADLPGPKIRIGTLAVEPVELVIGDCFTLTTEEVAGNRSMVSVTLKELPQAVRPGDVLFINDGLIQVRVEEVEEERVHCRVLVGGKLRSKKGLNLPGIDLGISAFTEHDRNCMRFALENGVDAISQSFVNDAADIRAVREAAAAMGYQPFVIAKIERASILEKIDQILDEADGVMVARGDLGVELPIEEIAIMQKLITSRANLFGKPVITATQMLESMTNNRRPTRAEATDVANAILDGTDCVMLSEESAMGRYPLEAVRMLMQIAVATEPHRTRHSYRKMPEHPVYTEIREVDYIASSVNAIVSHNDTVAAILAPTDSGLTARRLSRYKLPTWVLAVSANKKTCRELLFSYGVFPLYEINHPADWTDFARDYALKYNLKGSCIIQTEGPSPENPHRNHKMEIIDLREIR